MSAEDQDQPDRSVAASSLSIAPVEEVEKTNEMKNTADDQHGSDTHEYPHGLKLFLLLLSIYLAIFLVALDRTIIATALPQITDHFHSFADVGWYNGAFTLPTAAFQLFFGRMYTFYSPKWIFITLVFIFEIGSAVCGAAPSSIALIWGRAIAGLGAGGIFNGAMILMMYACPLKKRPVYMGLLGAVFGFASVAGPLVGGVFTTKVTWRWCFYINLPIGAAVICFLFFVIEETPAALGNLTVREKVARLDIYGTSMFVPSIVCLLLALQWGGQTYAWSDGRIIALLTLFGVLLIVFILIQLWRKEFATVPPRIFKKRTIWAGASYSFLLGSSFLMVVYFLSDWFQAIKGDSAIKSGYSTLPFIMGMVISSIFSGVLVGRIGYYNPLLIAAAIITPIGAGLLTLFKTTTAHPMWIGAQFLFGFGIGMGLQQTNIAAQTVLDEKDSPIGVSLVFFGQTLGGTVSVAMGQNILDNKIISGLSRASGINGEQVVNAGATGFRNLFHNKQQLSEVVVVYNRAIITVFYCAVGFACATIFPALIMEWKSVKKENAGEKDIEEGKKTEKSARRERVAGQGT